MINDFVDYKFTKSFWDVNVVLNSYTSTITKTDPFLIGA